jgi:hypothetical protein
MDTTSENLGGGWVRTHGDPTSENLGGGGVPEPWSPLWIRNNEHYCLFILNDLKAMLSKIEIIICETSVKKIKRGGSRWPPPLPLRRHYIFFATSKNMWISKRGVRTPWSPLSPLDPLVHCRYQSWKKILHVSCVHLIPRYPPLKCHEVI